MGSIAGNNQLRAPVKAFALAGAVCFAVSASAWTNLYSTRFEVSEGYNPASELIDQQGWTTDSASFGGNGLVDFLGTQAAYIGFSPLNPPANYLAIWQPINFSPVRGGNQIVKFSVLMAIIDSSNGRRDDFYWSAYNTVGSALFTIDFFNENLGVYYQLDGTNQLVYTGVTFTNDGAYTLEVTMDFSQNNWAATLNNVLLVTNQPITTVGARLTLGDVDGFWVPASAANPGDNYMIFDNYQVTADITPTTPPTLFSLGRNASGQFGLRLEGADGARYALEASTNLAQWTALRTDTAANGVIEFTDTGSAGLSTRFYRARLVP